MFWHTGCGAYNDDLNLHLSVVFFSWHFIINFFIIIIFFFCCVHIFPLVICWLSTTCFCAIFLCFVLTIHSLVCLNAFMPPVSINSPCKSTFLWFYILLKQLLYAYPQFLPMIESVSRLDPNQPQSQGTNHNTSYPPHQPVTAVKPLVYFLFT